MMAAPSHQPEQPQPDVQQPSARTWPPCEEGQPHLDEELQQPAARARSPRKARNQQPCWSCSAAGVPLKKCSMCAVALYCGGACQRADWGVHRGQCAGLKAAAALGGGPEGGATLEGQPGP